MTAALTTLEPTATPTRRLHLRPAPAVDPPYDDELAGPDGAARSLWLVPGPAEQLPFDEPPAPEPEPPDFAPRSTPRAELPCPRRMAAGLVQAVMEVIAGRRPLQQLMQYTTEEVYGELQCRVGAVRALRIRRGGGQYGPARLRSVHVDEPADGVAEVTAVVRRGERHRAVALRLEGIDGRWRCTALHVV